MNTESTISENKTTQSSSSVPENETNSQKSNRRNIFSKYFHTLKSLFQRPNFLLSKKCKNSSPSNLEINQNEFVTSPKRIKSNELLLFLLSLEIAMGGIHLDGYLKNNNGDSYMVCLPCYEKPPECEKKKEKREPVGLITQNKEMELNNGKLIFGCSCGKRNGLAGADCPRVCCQNNPGCTMNPPQCWPQFQEPPEPKPEPRPKMICIPFDIVYSDPSYDDSC